MSTTQPSEERYFQVFVPDQVDEGVEQRKAAVHDEHVTRLRKIHAETGILKCGGSYMSADSLAPNAEKKAIGAAFVVRAQTYEAVKELVENDPFMTANVWDKNKLVIVPFESFFSF